MTDADTLAVARCAANGFFRSNPAARLWPRDHWLSVAWERLARFAGPPGVGVRVRAGQRACLDALRRLTGRHAGSRRRRGCRPLRVAADVTADYGRGGHDRGWVVPAAPESDPAPEARRLALWCETRPQRRACCWVQRVRLYLWLVEGWTQAEVAATWGCTAKAVCAGVGHLVRELLGDATAGGAHHPNGRTA